MVKKAHSLFCSALLMLSAGCASFAPVPFNKIPLTERALTQEQAGLSISVALLSEEEARQLFSANLYEQGVQPVWVEVKNKTDKAFWFMLHGLDPNYFSTREVAYMNHYKFAGQTNRQMDEYFSKLGIEQLIPAGETVSGFAFTNEIAGTREINVLMYSDQDIRTYEFFATVPGIQPEWEASDFGALYSETELIATRSDEELRSALETLPCCTEHSTGIESGAPLNVVFIDGPAALRGMLKAGWDESIFKRDLSTLFDSATVFDRTPDLQFDKSRRLHDSAMRLRVWRTPIVHNGAAVWLGSVQRSGDGDVDDAAYYLLEDLASLGTVSRWGLTPAMPPVPAAEPRRGVGFTPYWTAGYRLALFATTANVPMSNIEILPWVPLWQAMSNPSQAVTGSQND